MTLHIIDALAIETVERFTFSEVAKLCELSHEETQELIDYGINCAIDVISSFARVVQLWTGRGRQES